MKYIRRVLASAGGKTIAIVVSLGLIGTAVWVIISFVHGGTPDSARYTMYICTETGKPYRHENKLGETRPIYSSFSGRNTGVPAEACYWTAQGERKAEPTWVLLNELVGKAGPTFCPECGRLVVGHNPAPEAGAKAPPTQQERSVPSAPRVEADRSRYDDR